jgi:uncharacterized membrane protein YgdD (TMEM256/DUF423 family)
MANSKELAGLIGPTMIALGATEALNLEMFAGMIAPVVYLNGMILFVVGLALVRAHNRWAWAWPVLITLTGWVVLCGGLYRMIAPDAPQAPQSGASYAMFAALALIGAFLSYKGYGPSGAPPPQAR